MTDEKTEGQRDAFGKQQFNIYLPPELVRELKHAAIDDSLSLSGYVERIIREFLNRRTKQSKER